MYQLILTNIALIKTAFVNNDNKLSLKRPFSEEIFC